MKNIAVITMTALALAACKPVDKNETPNAQNAALPAPSETSSSKIDATDIPEGIAAAAEAKIPGMKIAEVERKERDGMIFFDVEGTRPDGSEVELDMLKEGEAYKVVEVQRDIAWADVPEVAKAAAPDDLFTPVRVIESVQNNGAVIYELFEEGKPKAPSAEIAVKDGKAEMLRKRWKY